jgi:hypothetical protein
MEVLSKEKREKKEILSKLSASSSILNPNSEEPIVSSMEPEQEQMLLEELLGNFSDQTGACFG